ncbi:hypothetical protein HH308_20480 [Gordonia sp. TBRC 11910]|uniref:Uncharacterized protein n=1 Tax=Gordonia asplenii TaxID=2725283 RepID=A0A848KYC6_9ACTN|nr:hypothetical protein [Gordonia asplenii]NMO03596.1 hypothetical protein [Gordonia asplenii]
MNQTMKRTVASLAMAIGIAAGSTAITAAPAQAAGPGDLWLVGGVDCYFKGWGPTWDKAPGWRMHRWMGVKNIGGSTMTGVNVTEINGGTRQVKLPNQAWGELRPGQTFISVDTTWNGCWPASISGYTIGAQVENVFNNYGYWSNSRQMPGTQQLIPSMP